MKLTKQQKEAIERFERVGYVEVDAPRRSGKTFMIREYIKANPRKKFGIYTPDYRIYKMYYGDLKNAKYIMNGVSKRGLSVLIGDEVYLPYNDRPTITVRTSKALFWEPANISTTELKQFKKNLGKEFYYQEFGKYEKETNI